MPSGRACGRARVLQAAGPQPRFLAPGRDLARVILGCFSDPRVSMSVVRESEVGEGTTIAGHCNIYGASIGRDCKIQSYTYIEPGVRIGDGVIVRPSCHICEGVTIGDGAFLGPGVIFTNDLYPSTGARAKVLTTTVSRGAVIGAGAVLLPVAVGEGAMVAAGSVVTRDVPDFAVAAGHPARVVGSTRDEAFVAKQKTRDAGLDPRVD